MMPAVLLVLVVGLLGAGLILFARFAPRRLPAGKTPISAERAALRVSDAWDEDAAETFDALSEAQRCEMLFGVAVLDDGRARALLAHALADDSDAVALAAARGLAAAGRLDDVRTFAQSHPGARSERLLSALTLFGVE